MYMHAGFFSPAFHRWLFRFLHMASPNSFAFSGQRNLSFLQIPGRSLFGLGIRPLVFSFLRTWSSLLKGCAFPTFPFVLYVFFLLAVERYGVGSLIAPFWRQDCSV